MAGDGTSTSTPEMTTTESPTAAAITKKPSNEPTKAQIETDEPTLFEVKTSSPTKAPTPRPTPPPTLTQVEVNASTTTKAPTQRPTPRPTPPPILPVIEFPAAVTIQGLLWLDENENGLFEPTEIPMQGLFVNLRECSTSTWIETTTSTAAGQYQFTGVEEGDYYIQFFKPANPSERYEFTIPQVARDDVNSIDSDVVKLGDSPISGHSDCLEVKKDFGQLVNAGYIYTDPVPTKAPTPSPTPAPTPSPTPEPSMAPTSKAPTAPRFCAFVSGMNNEIFNFQGCNLPCSSADDCLGGRLCTYTYDCS